MIRIALCDDSELQLEVSRTVVSNYLQTRSEEVSIDSFFRGEELIQYVRENGGFDIYILDMIMPGMNGLETASLLRIMQDPGKIIFLTSTMEYAVQSYDVEASAYLMKPVDQDKLARCLNKIFAGLEKDEPPLLIQCTTEAIKIDPITVSYVALENRKLKYVLINGRVLMGKTIRTKFVDAIAPLTRYSMFVLCGLSLLINLKQVDAVSTESIMMKNGEILYPPISAMGPFKQAWWSFNN